MAVGPLTSKCVVANAFWVAHRIGRAPAIDWGKRPVFWRDIRSGAVVLQSLFAVDAKAHCANFSRGAFLTLKLRLAHRMEKG